MNGLAIGMQETGIGFLVLSTAAVLAAGLLLAVAYVFHRKEERSIRLKKAIKNTCIGWGVALMMGASWTYYVNAVARSAAAQFHTSRSDQDGGIYTARYAYLANDRILLKVYRTTDMTLLAQRTYSYPDAAMLVWTKHSLIYDTAASDGEGRISLPPSLTDRLFAKLP